MSTLFYSALDAPTHVSHVLFTVPPLVIGIGFLWGSWRRRSWSKNLSGTSGLIIQALFGGVFASAGASAMIGSALDTFTCRDVLRQGQASVVTGKLTIDRIFHKSGYGNIAFDIDGHPFTTQTGGFGRDCGYIQSLGQDVLRAQDTQVKAQVRNGKILRLESVQ